MPDLRSSLPPLRFWDAENVCLYDFISGNHQGVMLPTEQPGAQSACPPRQAPSNSATFPIINTTTTTTTTATTATTSTDCDCDFDYEYYHYDHDDCDDDYDYITDTTATATVQNRQFNLALVAFALRGFTGAQCGVLRRRACTRQMRLSL